jgi:hypothetical protein
MRCKSVEPLLSEYIDERLSARRTLEVERHLAECHACTRTLNELRRTVSLVQEAPALRVSEDFTAGLQARLQGLEPAPAPRAWLEGARALFRPRALPVWGAAAGLAALGIVLLIPRGEELKPPRSPVETLAVGTASHQNVAISAADPFADIGAANLAAHASAEAGGDGEIVF